jgi:hypothetical protein
MIDFFLTGVNQLCSFELYLLHALIPFPDPMNLTLLHSLPPHDPARFQTTDDLDEPDRTNGLRAEEAKAALIAIDGLSSYEQDTVCSITDQITNLLHLVHAEGHDVRQTLETALQNFLYQSKINN